MAEVMALIEQEREKSGLSAERFANVVGITSTTYSRQNNNRQSLGIESLRLYAKYFKRVGNLEMLRNLGAYALELTPDEIMINPSR